MKLFELAAQPSKSAAKVFESYFGKTVNFENVSKSQARQMLHKVRTLVREHRATREFHRSEQDPTYLKLVMLEQVLSAKLKEVATVAVGSTAGANFNQQMSTQGMPPANPVTMAGNQAKQQTMQAQQTAAQAQQNQQQQQALAAQKAGAAAQAATAQKTANMQAQPTQANQAAQSMAEDGDGRPYVVVHPRKGKIEVTGSSSYDAAKKAAAKWGLKNTAGVDAYLADVKHTAVDESQLVHNLYQLLREDEVQQAQVVLAAQDMVDKVQKMIEDVTAMQFKDLPALVDQVKSQVGVDQSTQFSQSATAALSGLVQNLQESKQQLEGAVGIITGQPQPQVPGAPDEAGDEANADLGLDAEELGGNMGGDEAMSGAGPEEEEEPAMPGAGPELGRARR